MTNLKNQGLERILNLASVFLKFNGIFLHKKSKYLSTINSCCGIFFPTVYLTFCIYSVFAYWGDVESLAIAQGIPFTVKVILCLIILLYKKKDWVRLVNKVELLDLHKRLGEEDRKEMDASIKYYNRFCIIYMVQMIVFDIFLYLDAIVKYLLPIPLYTFCDLNTLECYLSFTIFEIVMDIFMVPFSLSLSLIYIYIVLALICQIEAIKCALRKINANLKMEELSVIVDQHNEVCLIINEFQSITKSLFLVIYSASTLLVCVLFYMATRSGFPPDMNEASVYIPLTLIYMLEFYIYASGATKLSTSITSIGDVLYNTNWYEISDLKVRKSLVLLIQKSQTTKGLTIGRMLILDVSLFIKFMNNAFSFYTLMHNFGEKNK